MANLSDFPQDILTEIAGRLKSLEDYTSFASVSKSLRAAAKDEYFQGVRLRQHSPYLMLPVRDGYDDIRDFYSLVDNESIVASVKVPNFRGKSFLESLGWLLVTQACGSMSLLNPVSGSEILLPHQNTIPDYEDLQKCSDYFFFGKMVLSSCPNETSDFILMVIAGGLGDLAFWRLGDKAWNKIEKIDERMGRHVDIIYYGGGQFFGICYPGLVSVFKLSRTDNKIEGRVVTDFRYSNNVIQPDRGFRSIRLYILKTVDDSLIVITRSSPFVDSRGGRDYDYVSTKFEVYEVDIVAGTWKEIYNLGTMAVFLGHNSTIAVDASRFTGVGVKANHIYFTDDHWQFYRRKKSQGGGKDSGVYNLETRTVEQIYPGEPLLSRLSPSIWITPCF